MNTKKMLVVSLLSYMSAIPVYATQPLAGGSSLALPELSQLTGRNDESPTSLSLLQQIFNRTVELGLESPLSPRYRELAVQINRLQGAYLQNHLEEQKVVARDDADYPLIFVSIKEAARERTREQRRQQKRVFLSSIDPWIDFQRLDERALEELYNHFKEQENLSEKTNQKISDLIRFGGSHPGVGSAIPQVVRTGQETFSISTQGDHLLGYSVSELVYFAKKFGVSRSHLESNEAVPLYNGQTEFQLSVQDLSDLNQWLDEIRKWHNDFREIFATLVGNSFVELGQKSVRDLLVGIECTPAARQLLQSYPSERVTLLFNTVSINLEGHPYRDVLKDIIEQAFSIVDLRARDGQRKTFMRGTYRANIGLNQLCLICPYLNKVIKIKQLMEEFLGQGSFLDPSLSFGIDQLDMLRQFKVTELNDMIGTVMGTLSGGQRGGEYGAVQQAIMNQDTINHIERTSLELCERLLSHNSGINFYRRAEVHAPISPEQIRALYTDENGRVSFQIGYEGGIRHKNVAALMDTLRASSAVQAMLPEFPALSSELESLKTQLVGKLNRYSSLPQDGGFYSRNLVDSAFDYLETLVAKIVYQEQSGATQASVVNALNQLVGVAGSDLISGCSMGFAGRMSQILSGLVFSAGDELRDFIEAEKQKAYQTAVQQVLGTNHESSMVVREINELLPNIIGLSTTTRAGSSWVPSMGDLQRRGNAMQALELFAEQFNAVKVYHLTRQYLSTKFWQLNDEKEDESMYRFLEDLGFGSDRAELDRVYRVNGNPENRWQYSFFQQNLPSRLVKFLYEKEILFSHPYDQQARVFIKASGDANQFAITPRSRAIAERIQQNSLETQAQQSAAALRSLGYTPDSQLPAVRGATSD